MLYSGQTTFPGIAALLPVLGSGIVLLCCGNNSSSGVLKLLGHPVIQLFGRLSYSFYLWHWPILVLAGRVWSLGLGGKLLCILLSLVMAAVTHRLIENPIRFQRFLLPRSRLSVALAACLTLVTGGFCLLYGHSARHFQQLPQQVKFTKAADDLPEIYSNGCHAPYSAITSPECAFGYTSSDTTIVLFGDSHAAHWFPALKQLAFARHWRLISLTKSGCPAPYIELFDRHLGRIYTECTQWRDNIMTRIASLHPTVVLVSDFASTYIGERLTSAQWVDGLRTTLIRFSKVGLQTVVLRDPSPPGFDVPLCLSRAAWTHSGSPCTFAKLSLSDVIGDLEAKTVQEVPNGYWVDISSTICMSNHCSPVRNNMIIFRDSDHLTASYSASLAPVLEPYLDRLIRGSV
jgi:hypothetical protein